MRLIAPFTFIYGLCQLQKILTMTPCKKIRIVSWKHFLIRSSRAKEIKDPLIKYVILFFFIFLKIRIIFNSLK